MTNVGGRRLPTSDRSGPGGCLGGPFNIEENTNVTEFTVSSPNPSIIIDDYAYVWHTGCMLKKLCQNYFRTRSI